MFILIYRIQLGVTHLCEPMGWDHLKHLKGNLWLNLNKLRPEFFMSHPNILISLLRQNFAFDDGSPHCKAHCFLGPFTKWYLRIAKKEFWRNPEGLWHAQLLDYWAWINWSLPLIKLKTPKHLHMYVWVHLKWYLHFILLLTEFIKKCWGFSDMCLKIKFLVL